MTTAPSSYWSDFDDGRPPGVFVIDANDARRRATVRLIEASPGLRVAGDHPGDAGVLPVVVRAVPHVCLIGPQVLPGNARQLIAGVRHALPATPCVRTPSVIDAGPELRSASERRRHQSGLVRLLSTIYRAVGLSSESAHATVRGHVEVTRS